MGRSQALEAENFFRQHLEGPYAGEAYYGLSYANSETGRKELVHNFVNSYFSYKDTEQRDVLFDAIWTPKMRELSSDEFRLIEALKENPYGRLGALARYELAHHYIALKEPQRAAELIKSLGIVDKWQLTGPFENVSESGFDKSHAPIAQPKNDAEFTTKDGTKVSWFPVDRYNPEGWLYFNQHLETSNSVVFAQSFVNAPGDREVHFHLGNSGSIKVWVNDALVFSEEEERDNYVDTYHFIADLKKGYNRILVQNGSTDWNGSNMLLRVTDPAGNAFPDFVFEQSYRAYPEATEAPIRVVPNPSIETLRGKVTAGTANYIEYSTLIQYYMANDFQEEARAVLLSALERYPKNAALTKSMSAVLSQLEDETGSSALQEEIKLMPATNAVVLGMLLEQAEADEDWKEMEKYLDQMVDKYGDTQFTWQKRLNLINERGEDEKARKMITKRWEEKPNDPSYVIEMADILSGHQKKPKEARKLLNDFAKERYDLSIDDRRISYAITDGDNELAIALLKDMIDHKPNNSYTYERLADIYDGLGDKQEAVALHEQTLKITPYAADSYSGLADIYRDMENEEKALTYYRRALELEPYDYGSRDAIREITTDYSNAFDHFEEVDYYALYNEAPEAADYPDQSAAILALDQYHVIYPKGGNEQRSVALIKVFTQEGVDAFKRQNAGAEIEKAEILKADGTRHEGTRAGGNIVWSDLQPGDGILLITRNQNYDSGRFAGKFHGGHLFNTMIPLLRATYTLQTPKDMELTTNLTGLEIDGLTEKVETAGENTVRTWQSLNQPAMKIEANQRGFEDVARFLYVTNIPDWEYIADWYAELTYSKIKPDEAVRKKVSELFTGKEDLSEREEIEVIYEYITNDIRYISVPFLQSGHVPQKASKTILTKQGDCKDVSSLFVAMCEVRGIDANLVLINTRDRGRASLSIPGIGFNHCIARTVLDNTEYFVELTDENLPFGTGDWSLNNSFALTIPRKGESFNGQAGLIDPASRGINRVIREVDIELKDGDLIATSKNTRTNYSAVTIRQTYELDTQEDREKSLLQSMNGRYPRMEILDLEFEDDLYGMHPELNYTFSFKAEGIAQSIAGMELYEIKLSDLQEAPQYLALAERTQPIDLWPTFDAEEFVQTVNISAPQGKTLLELPKNISISNPFIDYELTYSKTGEAGIQLIRKLTVKDDIVPVADYDQFREDMLRVVEADKITLAFR